MDIPEDVVSQILVRLPVKSLLKFRCVCRGWRGLIGSRHFIDMHLRHPSQGNANEYLVLPRFELDDLLMSFYCRDQDGILKPTAADLRGFPNTVSISNPVNGICLVGGRIDRDMGWEYIRLIGYDPGHDQPLYLCNPAARELRKIPDRPFGRQRARVPIRSSYHSSNSFECKRVGAGFGYDHRSHDYKVVSIMLFIENHYYSNDAPYGPLKIEIYDLRSNSWRVADAMFPTIDVRPDPVHEDHLETHLVDLNIDSSEQGDFDHFTCGLFFNGSIHWNTSGYSKLILAFNVSDEVMRAIHLPRGISSFDISNRSLFLLEDSLALVQKVRAENTYIESTCFHVWVMVEYGDEESWVKRFYLQPEIHMDVLAFWHNTLICETREGELASCNLQEDAPQFRKHHHIQRYLQQGPLSWNMMGAMVMHKESLVRLR